jgi:hypothetical protein
METTENEVLMKLGRLTLEQYERAARKEERLSLMKKTLPADQWRLLLSLAVAHDEAANAYYRIEAVADDDAIGEAAHCVENAMTVLSDAGEAIHPEFYDDCDDLLELAQEEAELERAIATLEWARADAAEEQQVATAAA